MSLIISRGTWSVDLVVAREPRGQAGSPQISASSVQPSRKREGHVALIASSMATLVFGSDETMDSMRCTDVGGFSWVFVYILRRAGDLVH